MRGVFRNQVGVWGEYMEFKDGGESFFLPSPGFENIQKVEKYSFAILNHLTRLN